MEKQAAEIAGIWRAYREKRNIEDRNKLLTIYAPLVTRVVKALPHAYGCFTDENDMIGDGVFGLMDAIHKYNPEKKVKFESYASLRIRGAIIDKMRQMDVLSRNTRQKYKQIEEAIEQYRQVNSKYPSNEEIAQKTGLTEKSVRKVLEESTLANMISFEQLLETGEKDGAFGSSKDTPEDQYQEKELKELLKEAIDALNEREKIVVNLYYYEELTLREIGEVLEISESRASQILSKTMLALRKQMQKDELINA